jgi:hypothetical protein
LRVGSWLDYIIDINLSKKGWLGFSPGLGFSQDNSLCLLVLVYAALISSVYDIWLLNVKEDLNTLVNLLLCKVNENLTREIFY